MKTVKSILIILIHNDMVLLFSCNIKQHHMIASSFCQCNINSTGRNESKKTRRALLFWLQHAAFSQGKLTFYHIAKYYQKPKINFAKFHLFKNAKIPKQKQIQAIVGERILEISRFKLFQVFFHIPHVFT